MRMIKMRPEFLIEAEFQATTNVKTTFKPREKTPLQSTRDTSGIEKEFSLEPRKLLSFIADGEYVTIKPKEYLENEWDEINDAVRS
jgi:hypothetical protein